MASIEQESLASSGIVVPPGIDHDILADEIRRSRAWSRRADATQLILGLSLDGEDIGEARILPDRSGDEEFHHHAYSATIESLDTNPERYHLGMLLVARHTIVRHSHLKTLSGQDYRMVHAAPDIATHLHGWQHERTIVDGLVGFAYTRINPDLSVPQRQTIGRAPLN